MMVEEEGRKGGMGVGGGFEVSYLGWGEGEMRERE